LERRLSAVLAADMVGYSRLMERNEDDVLIRQKAHRSELVDPQIAKHRGLIVKTTGDGVLVTFNAAQDAVRCAIEIQQNMILREGDHDLDNRIQYRIGINLGDVVFDDDDIFGDGVNVAARLEGLAVPGGVCVSNIVHETLHDRLGQPFRDMGSQRIKNISRPIKVWQWSPDVQPEADKPKVSLQQQVKFCTSADGTQIAYASVGNGPPILKAPNWLNHLEYEWQSPFMGPFLAELASEHQLFRFDQRGNGLSDWDVDTISEDTMIEDMEAVVHASGLKKFALFGVSQGASFSVRYAIKHPEQVSCLVLFGGYLRGRLKRDNPDEQKVYDAAQIMIRDGWGSPNPVFRNFFTSAFLPDAPKNVQDNFDEVQRISTNATNALRIFEMNANVDTVELAKQVRVPTLVLHISGDRVAPVEEGRLLARMIPNARFAELPGNDHIAIQGQPCFDKFFEATRPFLREHDI
jgi:class 3 adenylate cyclase/pimeloyl-ACP methyl ester carboxylesterase